MFCPNYFLNSYDNLHYASTLATEQIRNNYFAINIIIILSFITIETNRIHLLL